MDGRQPVVLRLFLLQAACNAATIAGTLLSFLSKQWWVIVLAVAAFAATLVAQYLLYRASTKTTYHEFEDEREKKFVDFFCNWYDRDGSHNIYCKDLDWLDRPEVSRIVDVLKQRHASVSIFIREDDAAVCNDLRNAGVRIYLVPSVARSQMKMSMRIDNDDQEIIIRRKAPNATVVQFIRTDDKYLLGVAEDLFTAYRAQQAT
jgi:hypothetical protein